MFIILVNCINYRPKQMSEKREMYGTKVGLGVWRSVSGEPWPSPGRPCVPSGRMDATGLVQHLSSSDKVQLMSRERPPEISGHHVPVVSGAQVVRAVTVFGKVATSSALQVVAGIGRAEARSTSACWEVD